MAEFTFKQGPVMPERTWRCGNAMIEGPNGESIHVRNITEGQFLYTPGKITIAQFGVTTANDSISLQCNARVGSESHVAFAGLIVAVLDELRRHNPEVTFTPPKNENRVRRVGQLVGVIGLIYGIYFLVVNGLLADEAAGLGIGFGVGIMALSAFWIWATAPISSKPTTVEETLAWVGRAYGLSP